MLEQIIFRFCQVFVPPSLTTTDLNILQSSPILSLPGPSIYSDKHLFFFYWMKVWPARARHLIFRCCWGWGKNRINQIQDQIRKTHCTHYIISWKEEVGPSDGFCQKLLTLWREPAACSRSKRLQFSVSCLLRKYKFYFYLKLFASRRSKTVAEHSHSQHNKGSSWLVTCYLLPPAQPQKIDGIGLMGKIVSIIKNFFI